MANILKRITAEAKRIRKKSPKKHRTWQGFVKEASQKVKKGTTRKKVAKRKPAAKRKAPRKRRAAKQRPKQRKVTVTRSVSVVGKRKAGSRSVGKRPRRRMAGSGTNTNSLLAVGLLALGAYALFSKKQSKVPAGAPPLVTTPNPVRNQKAEQIVAWAAAGGLAIDAIIKLINNLNSQGDDEVTDIYDSINSGDGIPDYMIA